ncbi:MAG: uroporphyrinogen-III synthase, partial [Acidobacteria bacterium]|nr:uroporphyrinogen-III synthase [Acidobacteriota bacterium]
FLMGFGNLPLIVSKLTEHGMTAQRPIAVISKATTPEQRTVTGTLADIQTRVEGMPTPALIVVGDVVKLHETIDWFESKPLFGRRIVVTRAREQASDLKRLLEESGAQVVQFPTIEIAAPESWESLDRVLDALPDYQWLIFTSTNGVRSFFERLYERGRDARSLSGAKIAAVGDSTANDLRTRGILPDLVPERFLSTALLPLLAQDQHGIRTAVIRAAEGRDELIDELRKRGGDVDLAVAYRTVPVTADAGELHDLDVITFTSASTVDNFFAAFQGETNAKLVSMGPTTSAALNKHGKEPDAEAAQATVQSLHDAVLNALPRRAM